MDQVLCKECSESAAEMEYSVPLCASCREKFVRRPIPSWLKGGAIAIGVVIAISLFNFFGALNAGIAFERGKRSERQGDYAAAAGEYRAVLDEFPGSVETMGRLAIADLHARNIPEAREVLGKLEGKEVSRELNSELVDVMNLVEQPAIAPDSSATGTIK